MINEKDLPPFNESGLRYSVEDLKLRLEDIKSGKLREIDQLWIYADSVCVEAVKTRNKLYKKIVNQLIFGKFNVANFNTTSYGNLAYMAKFGSPVAKFAAITLLREAFKVINCDAEME